MKIKSLFSAIFYTKSVYVNFKLFDFKTALHMPIIVSNKVKCIGLRRGAVSFSEPIRRGMVKLGVKEGTTGIWHYDRCHGIIDFTGGNVVFGDNVSIARGFSLKCVSGGRLTIGRNFTANSYTTILCAEEITIGEGCLFAHHTFLNCGDGHKVVSTVTDEVTNKRKPVIIGNHVWVGAYSSILKGSSIADNSIVGFGSIVGKSFEEPNCVIAGPFPGRVVKRETTWKH
ncbi:MAG: acyltransferase [Lachnospiraceae bacterium]|nr:acyltransferase [Lachnospiraceae bacterium]